MAFKIDKRCKVCRRCVEDPAFMKRLWSSKAYVPGGEPLMQISRETGMNYRALGRHTSRHQGITNYELKVRTARVKAKQEADTIVKTRVTTADARQSVLDQLSQLLEDKAIEGGLVLGEDISVKDALALVLKASKDGDDVAAKRKDQELDVFKLMTSARSGANPALPPGDADEPFDPWAEGTEEGTEGADTEEADTEEAELA